jgi:DNA-binding MarR family transcriptional regulator
MKRGIIPTRETLEKHAEIIPEINPASIIAMLRVLGAASEIQHAIIDVLEREHQLSEGKLGVMIVLHQEIDGLAPSQLAEMTGVTRATISVMLRRMARDGLVYSSSDANDARAKKICLTEKGRSFMDEVLPGHYLRITKLMRRLTDKEQEELIVLLKKLAAD